MRKEDSIGKRNSIEDEASTGRGKSMGDLMMEGDSMRKGNSMKIRREGDDEKRQRDRVFNLRANDVFSFKLQHWACYS